MDEFYKYMAAIVVLLAFAYSLYCITPTFSAFLGRLPRWQLDVAVVVIFVLAVAFSYVAYYVGHIPPLLAIATAFCVPVAVIIMLILRPPQEPPVPPSPPEPPPSPPEPSGPSIEEKIEELLNKNKR